MNPDTFFTTYKKELIQLTYRHRREQMEGIGGIMVNLNPDDKNNAQVFYFAVSNPEMSQYIRDDILKRHEKDNRDSVNLIYFLENDKITVYEHDIENDKYVYDILSNKDIVNKK